MKMMMKGTQRTTTASASSATTILLLKSHSMNSVRKVRQLHQLLFFTTAAFIWIVPWLFIQEISAAGVNSNNNIMGHSNNRTFIPTNPSANDALSSSDVRKYLQIYNQGTSVVPTPIPTTTPIPKVTSNSNAQFNNNNKLNNGIRRVHFPPPSTTTLKSSFIPTEVMEASTTTNSPIQSNSNSNSNVQQVLPKPEGDNEELLQTLNLLNSLLGSKANADEISSALVPSATTTTTTTSTTTPKSVPNSATLSFDESLQALSLLNSLLGNNDANSVVGTPTTAPSAANINLGSSNALLASLGLPQSSSNLVTRQANQLSLGDPLTSSLTNLLFGGGANNNNNQQQQQQQQLTNTKQQQNFQNFKNTGAPMDSASTTMQLSGLLGLLNTLGQFGGSSQASSLFNFGQNPASQTASPNYLSSLFGNPNNNNNNAGSSSATTQVQQNPPNYLSMLFGGGPQAQKQAQQSGSATSDLLATILNGGTGKSQQDLASSAATDNLLGNLLGGGGGGGSNSLQNQLSASILAGLLGAQQQQQSPSLLGGLGSGIFSLAGNALSGLSGSSRDGKPRVRGVDTRLGLGYRFGPNADAQVMWEVGPQLFTDPLPNEQREAIVREREKQARRQVELQQQQMLALQRQLQEQQEQLRLAAEQASLQQQQRSGASYQAEASNQHVTTSKEQPHRKTNKRNQPPLPSMSDILFGPPTSAISLRPRPKQNGVSSFQSPRANAGAIPAKSKRNNDPYSMLTAYEKYLINQASSKNESPPVSPKLSKRANNGVPPPPRRMIPRPPNNKRGNGPPPPPPTPNQRTDKFVFSPILSSTSTNGRPNIPNRIVRMREINRVPVLLPPNKRRFMRRRPGPRPPMLRPNNPSTPNRTPSNDNVNSNFANRVGVAATSSAEPRMPGRPHPIPQYRQRFQRPRRAPAPSPDPDPTQNAKQAYPAHVPAAEDSFLRRNAGYGFSSQPQQASPMANTRPRPNAFHRPNHQQRPPFNNNRRTIFSSREDGLPNGMVSHLRPSANSIYGMWNKLTNMDNPITKMIMGENSAAGSENYIPPDAFDTFNCYFCNGDYVPTKQPPVIAKPIPTKDPNNSSLINNLVRLPSMISNTIVNTMVGQGKPESTMTPNMLPPQPYPTRVHVGGSLTPEQIAHLELINPGAPQDEVEEEPFIKGTKINFQSSQMLNLVPTTTRAPTSTKPPLQASGVEMFIDIDSGEISVRKSIGKLSGFGGPGEYELPTTTPRPKSQEELDEEESQKIFQQVQEYLYNSYEEMKFNEALEKEMKKHKERLNSGKDEVSHGMVSQYFDVIGKRVGQPGGPGVQVTPSHPGVGVHYRTKRDIFSNAMTN